MAGFAAVVRSLAPGLDPVSLLGQVVDNLPDPVVIVDVGDDFRIVYSNPVHSASVRAERLPLVGRPLRHAYDKAEESGLLEAVRTAAATGQRTSTTSAPATAPMPPASPSCGTATSTRCRPATAPRATSS
jgi:hypothetical protein